MAVSGILEISAGTVPGSPGSGLVDLYIDTSDLRFKSIDNTPTTRVYVDRDSSETLTNKTVTNLVASAGTTGAPPLTLTSGTLMTTSTAGCLEYDGTSGYFSHAASGRGVLPNTGHITLTSTYTLTSQTAAQKLFNAPTSGQVTLAGSTTYYFECLFSLTSMSGSSGAFGFAFAGTASVTRQAWEAMATKSALATASAPLISYNTAANVAISAANTTTTGHAWITGKLVVGTGGTLIPQVSLGVSATAVVGNDSYFRIWPAGSSSVQSVGNWS